MADILIRILEIWRSGGWVMVALAALAVLLYASGFQLLFFLRKGNLEMGHDSEWRDWIQHPEQAQGRTGEIIRYAQENVQSNKQIRNRFDEVRQSLIRPVERRLLFLNTMVAAAPLMGLLGTVIGMQGTFDSLSSGSGSETIEMVSAGISEALITTQTGLFIALPGLFLAMIIRQRKHTAEATLARIESLILSKHDFS